MANDYIVIGWNGKWLWWAVTLLRRFWPPISIEVYRARNPGQPRMSPRFIWIVDKPAPGEEKGQC